MAKSIKVFKKNRLWDYFKQRTHLRLLILLLVIIAVGGWLYFNQGLFKNQASTTTGACTQRVVACSATNKCNCGGALTNSIYNYKLGGYYCNAGACVSPNAKAEPDPTCSVSASGTVPNCGCLRGPSKLKVGETGIYSAKGVSPQENKGNRLRIGVATSYGNAPWTPESIFADISGTGKNYFTYGSWTPKYEGTYIVSCRAWNDSIAECRDAPYVEAGKPQYACSGPTDSMKVYVSKAESTCKIDDPALRPAVENKIKLDDSSQKISSLKKACGQGTVNLKKSLNGQTFQLSDSTAKLLQGQDKLNQTQVNAIVNDLGSTITNAYQPCTDWMYDNYFKPILSNFSFNKQVSTQASTSFNTRSVSTSGDAGTDYDRYSVFYLRNSAKGVHLKVEVSNAAVTKESTSVANIYAKYDTCSLATAIMKGQIDSEIQVGMKWRILEDALQRSEKWNAGVSYTINGKNAPKLSAAVNLNF